MKENDSSSKIDGGSESLDSKSDPSDSMGKKHASVVDKSGESLSLWWLRPQVVAML